MRCIVRIGLLLAALPGCASLGPLPDASAPPVPLYSDNPLLMPVRDATALWEALTDVVDDYFRIESEQPVKMVGDTLTEGRLDTFPEVGSTYLEPWRHDSADAYERLESTLQSIRRTAHVRVVPSEGGFLVDVAVFKELEDVKRPAHVSAGAATFRTEGSMTRVVSPIGEQDVNKGWIGLGRDRALEQRILAHLQERLKVRGLSPMPPAVPAAQPSAPSSGPSCQPGGTSCQPGGSSCQPGGSSGQPSGSGAPPQRSAPAPAPNGRVGARDPDDAPMERRVFRLPFEEVVFEPGRQGPEFLDAVSNPSSGSEPAGFGPEYPDTGDRELGGFSEPQAALESGVPAIDGTTESFGEEPVGGRWRRTWRPELGRLWGDVKSDYSHFYSFQTLALFAPVLGASAALANTSADEHFQQWHQEHVFTHDVSRFAYFVAPMGVGKYMVPLYVFCTVAQPEYEPGSPNWMIAEWGRRSFRSFLVGGPALLTLQYVLGSDRPEKNLPHGSYWEPFKSSHGASGDAFIGAITFMNAAEMTDNMPLKTALYAFSTVPAWTRVAHDKHYLSQAVLGWWLGYLSTRAVNLTDTARSSNVVLTPVLMENGGFGIGLMGQW